MNLSLFIWESKIIILHILETNSNGIFRYWSTEEEAASKLQERVQHWEEQIVPSLEEEESMLAFDAHKYMEKLSQKFEDVGEIRQFFQVNFFNFLFVNIFWEFSGDGRLRKFRNFSLFTGVVNVG